MAHLDCKSLVSCRFVVAVVVAVALLSGAAMADPWQQRLSWQGLTAGSTNTTIFSFPAFVNNLLSFNWTASAASGSFAYAACLNRFLPPPAPTDPVSGAFSLANWASSCNAALPSRQVTSEQYATQQLTFVATGVQYLTVVVSNAPEGGFDLVLELTADACAQGYSPDCSVPSMLPVGNTVLQPGATIAVEVPSVPQLADSLTLSFEYVDRIPSGKVYMYSLTTGNVPSQNRYNFTGSQKGLVVRYPRSCPDPSCTYFGVVGNDPSSMSAAELSNIEASFANPTLPANNLTALKEGQVYSSGVLPLSAAQTKFYQVPSGGSFSVGVIAAGGAANATTAGELPTLLVRFGALPYITTAIDAVLFGGSGLPSNTTLFYTANDITTPGILYVGFNASSSSSSDNGFLVWFNSPCPANCNGANGVCNNQTHLCACAAGFEAPDCAPAKPPGPPGPPGPAPAPPSPPWGLIIGGSALGAVALLVIVATAVYLVVRYRRGQYQEI